jgi:hypothetical protein
MVMFKKQGVKFYALITVLMVILTVTSAVCSDDQYVQGTKGASSSPESWMVLAMSVGECAQQCAMMHPPTAQRSYSACEDGCRYFEETKNMGECMRQCKSSSSNSGEKSTCNMGCVKMNDDYQRNRSRW